MTNYTFPIKPSELTSLVTKLVAKFVNTCFKNLFNESDIEDLTGEAICKMLASSGSFNPDKAQLNTWISVVSFRFFLNFKKSKIDSNGLVTIYEQWDDKIMNYKQECHSQVRMDVVKAIESLKNATERDVARELLLDGIDIQEVAASHQLSVDYTYTVKSRAMAHLRKLLKDYVA